MAKFPNRQEDPNWLAALERSRAQTPGQRAEEMSDWDRSARGIISPQAQAAADSTWERADEESGARAARRAIAVSGMERQVNDQNLVGAYNDRLAQFRSWAEGQRNMQERASNERNRYLSHQDQYLRNRPVPEPRSEIAGEFLEEGAQGSVANDLRGQSIQDTLSSVARDRAIQKDLRDSAIQGTLGELSRERAALRVPPDVFSREERDAYQATLPGVAGSPHVSSLDPANQPERASLLSDERYKPLDEVLSSIAERQALKEKVRGREEYIAAIESIGGLPKSTAEEEKRAAIQSIGGLPGDDNLGTIDPVLSERNIPPAIPMDQPIFGELGSRPDFYHNLTEEEAMANTLNSLRQTEEEAEYQKMSEIGRTTLPPTPLNEALPEHFLPQSPWDGGSRIRGPFPTSGWREEAQKNGMSAEEVRDNLAIDEALSRNGITPSDMELLRNSGATVTRGGDSTQQLQETSMTPQDYKPEGWIEKIGEVANKVLNYPHPLNPNYIIDRTEKAAMKAANENNPSAFSEAGRRRALDEENERRVKAGEPLLLVPSPGSETSPGSEPSPGSVAAGPETGVGKTRDDFIRMMTEHADAAPGDTGISVRGRPKIGADGRIIKGSGALKKWESPAKTNKDRFSLAKGFNKKSFLTDFKKTLSPEDRKEFKVFENEDREKSLINRNLNKAREAVAGSKQQMKAFRDAEKQLNDPESLLTTNEKVRSHQSYAKEAYHRLAANAGFKIRNRGFRKYPGKKRHASLLKEANDIAGKQVAQDAARRKELFDNEIEREKNEQGWAALKNSAMTAEAQLVQAQAIHSGHKAGIKRAIINGYFAVRAAAQKGSPTAVKKMQDVDSAFNAFLTKHPSRSDAYSMWGNDPSKAARLSAFKAKVYDLTKDGKMKEPEADEILENLFMKLVPGVVPRDT